MQVGRGPGEWSSDCTSRPLIHLALAAAGQHVGAGLVDMLYDQAPAKDKDGVMKSNA